MTLLTEQGKEAAQAGLQARRKANRGKPRVANWKLPAGSPMTYYCITCGADIVVPENWMTKSSTCEECSALHALGWLE